MHSKKKKTIRSVLNHSKTVRIRLHKLSIKLSKQIEVDKQIVLQKIW